MQSHILLNVYHCLYNYVAHNNYSTMHADKGLQGVPWYVVVIFVRHNQSL